MRNLLFISVFLLCSLGSTSKMPPPPLALLGIQTHQNFTSVELVRDIFLKNGCKNVDNIKTTDNGLAVGYFEGGGNIFGMNSGIIISSGDIKLAEGPNEDLESTFAYNVPSVDPDINAFSTASPFDVAGIEFDFIPVGHTVSFDYAFASEEYCEFVGSIFNDVFGFFVSGPGINGPYANGAINVALVPNTNDFVAINSINHLQNSSLYIKNELLAEADECNIPYDPQFLDLIEYDGMTTKLTAAFDVIPCETYHIRLLVADVGDDILDSGVFLGTKTFDLNSEVQVTAVADGSNEPIAVEGCRDGRFDFHLPYTNQDEDIVVYIKINENSTAENGVDFTAIPDSIIIPIGESNISLPIEVLADQIDEGTETIILEMVFACDCLDPQAATLFIEDPEPVEIETNEITACAGQQFTINPIVLSGAAPFSYLWEDGSTTHSLTTSINQSTEFLVTVTDDCGITASGLLTANIQPIPEVFLSGEMTFCEGEEAFFDVVFEGAAPWSIQYSIDDIAQPPISGIVSNPFPLAISLAGTYKLTVFNDANCLGLVGGTALATQAGSTIEYATTPPSCFNTDDGAIELTIHGEYPPFDIKWNPSVNDPAHPTGLVSGTYTISVTDGTGCLTLKEIVLDPDNFGANCKPYSLYVPNIFSPNDDGFNDEFRLFPSENSNISLVKKLHVFNRWGAVVYENDNFIPDGNSPLWDGSFKGKRVDAGVFVWQVVLILENGLEELLAGDVTVVR